MKNFYKIIAIFLLLFSLGLFISYVTITKSFKKSDKEESVTKLSTSIIKDTYQVS